MFTAGWTRWFWSSPDGTMCWRGQWGDSFPYVVAKWQLLTCVPHPMVIVAIVTGIRVNENTHPHSFVTKNGRSQGWQPQPTVSCIGVVLLVVKMVGVSARPDVQDPVVRKAPGVGWRQRCPLVTSFDCNSWLSWRENNLRCQTNKLFIELWDTTKPLCGQQWVSVAKREMKVTFMHFYLQ